MQNSFSYEKFRTRFETETQENSEMAYSELILSDMSVSGKCFKHRVFNMAERDTEGRRTLILRRKIICHCNEKEKADNAAACFAIY